MKKLLTLLVVAALTIGFAGCNTRNPKTLNIGITDYPPLNYYENGELIGFETEFAKEVCQELDLQPNFIEIDWDSKEMELKSKNIDVVWNGMTWTEERAKNMLLSNKYLANGSVLVVKKGAEFNPQTDSVAVEKGSGAEREIEDSSYFADTRVVKVDSMTKGFLEVQSGNVTGTWCDVIAAIGMLKEGNDNLEIFKGYSIMDTNFALGFRKEDTELCNSINKIMTEMKQDGRMKKIAEKYGLEDYQ